MTEQTTLERMADAIGDQMAEDENDNVSIARAALLAIREPGEDAMTCACLVGPDSNSGPFSYDDARTVWVAMIDAILVGAG